MTDVNRNADEALIVSGFRVISTEDELAIAKDNNAYASSTRRRRVVALCACVVFAFWVYVVEFIRIRKGLEVANVPWTLLLICTSAPLILVLRALYPGIDDLLCTRESVQVTHKILGKFQRVRLFPVTDVRGFRYVAEAFPWFGRTGCLGFFAAGKQVTCLPGVKGSEAQQILDELEKRGFDVIRVPEASATDNLQE